MKRIIRRRTIILIILCMVFSLLAYNRYWRNPALHKETLATTGNAVQNLKPSDSTPKDESYILLDTLTDQVLLAQNENMPKAPASTTKLLTGLVAMRTLKENDIVRVGEEVNVEGSRLGLHPGDEITVHGLLTAMYLASANDAAAALAVKVSGSISSFANIMNEYAAGLGCQQSHFRNPHGMPDPAHFTTASDLCIIAKKFIKNEILMKYVQQRQAKVEWKDFRGALHSVQIHNTNKLLGVYPGNQGLKTGTTNEAGQCLISYTKNADGALLLVLLGSRQRYLDTVHLLDEGWAKLRPQAALKGLASDPRILFNSPGFIP